MRGVRVFALLAAAWLAAGCAYEAAARQEVAAPARLKDVRQVAVAPFVYKNDWTAYFREVYRRAGVPAPRVKKVERVEATFLLEDGLVDRGFRLTPWPDHEGVNAATGMQKVGPGTLAKVRGAGADAVLLAEGRRNCESLNLCTARLHLRLVDAATGATIWEANATGSTLLSQGDEMWAAVRTALDELPRRSH